jgi:hypothetical protein
VTAGPAADRSGAQAPQALLSDVIDAVLREAGERSLTLGDLVACTGERGFGLMMVILGLPMLIPILPPGSSTIVGPIYAVFAVQMLRGARHPWLPRRLRDRVLSASAVRALRQRGVPMIRAAERWSRPRGVWFAEHLVLRLVGGMVLAMGLILLGPFPFLNTPPAVSVMLMGIALLNNDILFLLIGFLVGGASIGVLGLSVELIIAIFRRVREALL